METKTPRAVPAAHTYRFRTAEQAAERNARDAELDAYAQRVRAALRAAAAKEARS